ncbi:hypothetical protein MMC31_007096 [Peltigera leucophlebia]|nr:hypothetical protein [Peltigera leucophlebia]
MNPSHQNDRGQTDQAPTAEEPLASPDANNTRAEMKIAEVAVSNLETPRGRPLGSALDRSHQIRNNPDIDPQQQSGPSSPPLLLSAIAVDSQLPNNSNELLVMQQQLGTSPAPLPQASPLVTSRSSSDSMNSPIAQPSSAADLPPTTSYPRPLTPTMPLPQPITHLSDSGQMSPNMRAMLQDAFNEGRSEERRENKAKLDEAEEKIEQLRKRLDPSRVKAAYNQGLLEGSIAGYNKYSLNPETKSSDDRLAFEKILQDKEKAIQNQQTILASYQKELMTRKLRIENLEGQVRTLTPEDHNLMKADLANWQVQWGLITANVEEWKLAFNTKASELGSCQRELENSSRELRETKDEVGSLKANAMELESKFNTLNFDFNSLDRLYTTLAAERVAENEAVKTWNEELEGAETIRRQMLMDELDNKGLQLHDAKKQIKELNQILFAASSQLPQSLPSAPVSSPPHEASPASKPSSPPKASTSPAEGTRSPLRLPRFPAIDAGTIFSPRRLLILFFIFLIAILVPYLHSLCQQTNENTNSWEVINEGIDSGSREDRIRWEAWAFDNLEQNKGSPPSQEEGWQWTEEVRDMGSWNV